MAEAVRHYLLRLWREGRGSKDSDPRGAWRASLRSVKDGSLLNFSDPEALLRFLDEAEQGEPEPFGS